MAQSDFPFLYSGHVIVGTDGKPRTSFQTWINNAFTTIKDNISDLATQLGLIEAAQSAADAAQAAADTAQAAADAAQADADAAMAAIDLIGDDNILASVEKRRVVIEYNKIIAEQSGIDTEATRYAITTQKTAYDSAVSALTSYLATLTTPVLWSDNSNYTDIVDATWESNWQAVYSSRNTLLNKIAEEAKALADAASAEAATAQTAADAAQAAADAAQADATSSLAALDSIGQDDKLARVEKRRIIREYNDLTAEQTGIDAKATAYGITTEKTAYDNAVSALTTYLGGLTSPVAWNVTTDYTTIVYATWQSTWSDVYSTRQTLLNKIAEIAGTTATWGSVASRPTELTDGRITDALSSSGRLINASNLFVAGSVGVRNTNDTALTGVDNGASAKIDVADHDRKIPGTSSATTVNYNAGSITGLSFSTRYFVYCDDAGAAGGTVSYQATTNSDNLVGGANRVYVGECTTPANGGTATTGTGPGLPGGGGGGTFIP